MSDDHRAIMEPIAPSEVCEGVEPFVAAVLRANPDAATLRELVELQREHRRDLAEQALTRALVEVRRQIPAVLRRDRRVQIRGGPSYSYIGLATINEIVNDYLPHHDLTLTWEIETPSEREIRVTAVLTHAAGASKRNSISAPPDAGPGRNKVQAIGSTITYLQRYTAMAILGLASAEQDDADDVIDVEPSEDLVDVAKNQQAASWMSRHGLSVYDAEEEVGMPVSEWTEADRVRLRKWAEKQLRSKQGAPQEDETLGDPRATTPEEMEQ